uniref:HEAT repeat protein n=1 Tax=Haemonchus contortus TaxID=6289 RepID=A0A7I4XXY3_HAECO|nr:HEAT domain containing protein [Haemonchus contortus]
MVKTTLLAKKRKHVPDVSFATDVKRVKQDLESNNLVRRPPAIPLSKRRAVDVLSDVLSRLQGGDRQIASILLREFSIEHLPTLTDDIEEVVNIIITSASVTTYDQIARQLLRMLLCIMRRTDGALWNVVLQRLLSDAGKEANLFTRTYLDDGLLLLLTEGLNTGAISADCIPIRVLRCADRCLHSSAHGYRCAAIGFHVARVMSRRPDSTSLLVLERLLCQMTTDMDSRVRLSAIEGLSLLSGVEDGLTIHTYNTVKNSVGDSHRQVRILALRILLVFANRMPTLSIISTFSKSSDTKLQLCDDAFSIVCNAVNDHEVMVRTEAATILGEFQMVSDSFLDQTLDKKMMKTVQDSSGREQVKKVHQSRFAITQGAQQPTRESRWKYSHLGYQRQMPSASSEWSSGKELNARCPPTDSAAAQDDETESIVPRGACGAFVSALEDEFMSVRRAAVFSLGKLASTRPSFATTALDHLADMFNDEIVEVRLDAIAALTPLIVHGELQKEQLETVLKCLDDAIVDSRQALRDLLAKAEFADAECMRICSRALLNCLHRFPSDKNQIYRCLSEVGAHHAVFVHGMVRELLGLHLVYDTREQQIDDVFYIAKLILVLNAAANYEPIVSLLPECILRHYRFLRAAASDLVAPIKVLEKPSTSSLASSSPPEELADSTSDILVNAYERLQEVIREPTLADRNALRRFIVEEANAISAFNEPLAGAARFIASLCEICSALESLTQVVLRGGGDTKDASNIVHQELVRIRCAEHQFAGLPPEMASFLIEAGMFLSLLELLVEMTISPERYAQIVMDIRAVIREAERRWAANGEPCEQAVSLITAILDPLERYTADSKKILSVGTFGHLLVTHAPLLPSSFPHVGEIRSKWAQISEPNRDVAIEKPIRFVAGLPCAVKFVASLHNLTENDLRNLRVQVDYPNNTRDYFRPLATDISKEGDRVSSLVLISSSEAWSDAADVTLTLVLLSDSSQKAVSVPLLDSPSSAQPASVRLRAHPMTRT